VLRRVPPEEDADGTAEAAEAPPMIRRA
jgi:hypothetical protein